MVEGYWTICSSKVVVSRRISREKRKSVSTRGAGTALGGPEGSQTSKGTSRVPWRLGEVREGMMKTEATGWKPTHTSLCMSCEIGCRNQWRVAYPSYCATALELRQQKLVCLFVLLTPLTLHSSLPFLPSPRIFVWLFSLAASPLTLALGISRISSPSTAESLVSTSSEVRFIRCGSHRDPLVCSLDSPLVVLNCLLFCHVYYLISTARHQLGFWLCRVRGTSPSCKGSSSG